MAAFIKVFGERNCGTNWLETFFLENAPKEGQATLIHHREFLLTHCPPAFFERLERLPEAAQSVAREAMFDRLFAKHGRDFMGWKHTAIRPQTLQADARFSQTAFVLVVKHPVHFLLSLYRNPYHDLLPPRADLEAFLTAPWITLGRDGLGPVILESPLDLWSRKARSYLRFVNATPNATLLRYEDLLADFEGHMGAACGRLGIEVASLSAPQASAKAEREDFAAYRQRYLSGSPWDKLEESMARLARAQLDDSLLTALGYAD
ncbi:sulfotransferase [Pseudoruegeria sp. SHC-113]|nr:sulfotransferase [Pseudoruegeria sp. SHC-113]MCT8160791.1 sulfotransferase [Pseudoruegeria sp. SHC-113]